MRRTLGLISQFYTNGGRWVNKSRCQRNAQNKILEVCIMIHERKGGHFRRQYSAQAKKAGEAMMKVMRDFSEPLSVQDARDACTFCRNILESQVRGCPYNDAALEAEEDLDAVANADEPDA